MALQDVEQFGRCHARGRWYRAERRCADAIQRIARRPGRWGDANQTMLVGICTKRPCGADVLQHAVGAISENANGLDHGVAVVGYGTDPTSGDYWIVRNSWGSAWGENGYVRLKRGVNACGVANFASYPTAK